MATIKNIQGCEHILLDSASFLHVSPWSLHLALCASKLLNSNAYTLKYVAYSIAWKYTNHAWMDTNLQQPLSQIVSEHSQMYQRLLNFFIEQVYLSGFSSLRRQVPFHTMFWLSLLLLILQTLCVFLCMNPLSLWYSMATWTLERNTIPSNPTHRNGSFLKDLFQDKSPSKDPEPKRHVAPVASCEPILCLS